jgi:hypothetical protein
MSILEKIFCFMLSAVVACGVAWGIYTSFESSHAYWFGTECARFGADSLYCNSNRAYWYHWLHACRCFFCYKQHSRGDCWYVHIAFYLTLDLMNLFLPLLNLFRKKSVPLTRPDGHKVLCASRPKDAPIPLRNPMPPPPPCTCSIISGS